MKNIKKIVLCFILIFVSIFSFACSKVNLSTTLKSSGEIVTFINVNLEDVPTNRNTICNVINEYYSQLNKKYEENMIYYFSFVYDNEDFNALSTNLKMEHIIADNVQYLVGDGESYCDTATYKFFTIKKQFASIYAYLMYFCPSAFEYDAENNKIKISDNYKSMIDLPIASKDGEVEEDEGVFVTKYIQTCCPFYYNNEEPKFLYDCNEGIFSGANNISVGDKLVDVIENLTGFTDENLKLNFNFTTPYKRLHSTGNVEMSADGYTHSWTFDSVDGEVVFWREYANYAPWYVTVIIVAVAGLIVSLLIALIIKKYKTKKSLKILEKIDDFEITNKEDKK